MMNEETINTDLIFLQQCGENRVHQMNEIGLNCLQDVLNADSDLLKQLPGVYTWHVNRWKLQAQILINDDIAILEKPQNHSDFVYYDIETDIRQNIVWLIGVYDPIHDSFRQFFAKNKSDEKKILEEFSDYMRDVSCTKLCSYSASNFDRRVLKNRLIAQSIDSSPFDSTEETDFGLFVQKHFLARVPNYKLRTIGDFFDYPWSHKHDIDGLYVALSYEKYQRDNAFEIDWNRLLEYNRDDVLAIPFIINKMRKEYIRIKPNR